MGAFQERDFGSNISSPPRFEPQRLDRNTYPLEAEKQAHSLRISETDIEIRPDAPLSITVDGDSTLDKDDAFAEEQAENTYFIHISISDVSSLIEKDSPIDIEAKARSFTEYYGKRGNRPMIPRVLSEDRLSLHERVPRPTLTASTPLSLEGKAGGIAFEKTKMKSQKSFTYKEADEAIMNGSDEHGDTLRECKRIAELLAERRRYRGAEVVFDLEKGIGTSEEGITREIPEEEAYMSDMIIREFMILTNEKVAEFMDKNDIPTLYRSHTDINQRGFYSTRKLGHVGLGLDRDRPYLHFTSPIRRYPDLIVHRQISAFMEGRELPYTVEDLDRIAEVVNRRQNEIKDREIAEIINHPRYRRAREAVASDNYAELTERDLKRAMTVALFGEGLTPNFEREISARLETDGLGIRALNMLLYRGSPEIRKSVIAYLEKDEHLYKEVLANRKQIASWSKPVFSTKRVEGGVATIARVRREGVIFSSREMVSTSDDESRRLAGVDLIRNELVS